MSKLIQYSAKLAHCYKKDYYMAEYDFILEKKSECHATQYVAKLLLLLYITAIHNANLNKKLNIQAAWLLIKCQSELDILKNFFCDSHNINALCDCFIRVVYLHDCSMRTICDQIQDITLMGAFCTKIISSKKQLENFDFCLFMVPIQ